MVHRGREDRKDHPSRAGPRDHRNNTIRAGPLRADLPAGSQADLPAAAKAGLRAGSRADLPAAGQVGPRTGTVALAGGRSEERRVGKECTVLCRSRWSPYH